MVKSSGQVSIGGRLSSTVTVATHIALLPHGSVTVSSTVFSPMSSQVKLDLSIDKLNSLAGAQLSTLPPLTSLALITARPFSSNSIVISWQIGVGGVLSSTSMI